MTVDHHEPRTPELSDFIRRCVERAGGAVEEGPGGALHALLPPELEIAAGRSLVRLALSAHGPDEDAQPAFLGSPFMDALIAFAAGRGTVGSGYLPAGRLKRKGLREEVERTLRFSNCRTRYDHDEADVLLAATVQFDFKVAFLSEERREKVYVVPVDLVSNQVHLALAERLAGLAVEGEAPPSLPEAPLVPVEAAYETACGALRRIVAEDAARHQVRVAQRFAVEFGRISDYYGQVLAGLEQRRARALRRAAGSPRGADPIPEPETRPDVGREPGAAQAAGSLAGDGVRREAVPGEDAFAEKIESVRRERERKLRELGETYGLRVRARLSSARCLRQPKAYFKVSIDRGPTTRTLVLGYDGLLERLELPSCDSCRRETQRLWASPTAQLLCPACAGQ